MAVACNFVAFAAAESNGFLFWRISFAFFLSSPDFPHHPRKTLTLAFFPSQ